MIRFADPARASAPSLSVARLYRETGLPHPMELNRLIEGLVRPDAYPHPVDDVEVHHTHISVVFLANDWAYKVKKPRDLGFLDFTTLEQRRHFCEEEVRLNRRLAPGVYLGVVPVTVASQGGLEFGGEGEPVEYAVLMRRLPPAATLRRRMARGEVEEELLHTLARRIAGFHVEARGGPEVARFGRWEVVARNARENVEQAEPQIGEAISSEVHVRLSDRIEAHLAELRPLVEERAERGVPRDTHGDLHMDHVYLFPERPPPYDLVVIDCIEFSERFRNADPVSDMAFLAMDLIYVGEPELEASFSRAYFEAAGDREGRRLLPFYRSYRAAVRGKVLGMTTGEEVPASARTGALRRARGHWLLALSELEEPDRRPGLVLVAGLPGTGKSTLAQGLARELGARVISSDRVRKELAGAAEGQAMAAAFEEGIYSPEWTTRTYESCLEQALSGLFRGERIVVDASFSHEHWRRRFLEAAREMGVRSIHLTCVAAPRVVRDRLDTREEDWSDADWNVYESLADRWEEPTVGTRKRLREVRTDDPTRPARVQAVHHLVEAGLYALSSPGGPNRKGSRVLDGEGGGTPNGKAPA